MMKKNLLILAFVMVALLLTIGNVLAQAKPGIIGAWAGYTILGDGSRMEFTLAVGKGEEGLTGKIADQAGMMEIMAKNMVFAEGKLTFDIDYPQGMEVVPIKVSLTLDGDSLKGFWTDPEGNSNVIDLARKK
jgi:hypothetical protein